LKARALADLKQVAKEKLKAKILEEKRKKLEKEVAAQKKK